MNNEKTIALQAVEENAHLVRTAAEKVWEYAELSLQEEKSAKIICDICEGEGFRVERGVCNIPTAFTASFGEGRPVIGILAEYDALSGLSQKAGSTAQEELIPGGCGHGCGHNLLGAGALGAALGVKAWLEAAGKPGTVILFGCPGEEGGAAKAFMAREELWRSLDAALTWHPDDVNEVVTGSTNACIQVQYKFHGIASHAAGAPEKGRSALDAVELMNIGVQFLREHMSDRARVHYAITDGGGRSPNVVQPTATVLYMVRSDKVAEAVSLQKRVDKIAQGAALMTETTYDRLFIDGLAETIPNHTLERLLQKNFEEVGVLKHTNEELAFADALSKTYAGADAVPGAGSACDDAYADQAARLQKDCGHAMNDFLLPLFPGNPFNPGSSDVGDVSWQTPVGQIHAAAWPNGCPGHSWQNVSCAGTEMGARAAVHAGKVLATAAVELMTEPETLAQARAEFEKATKAGYTCTITKDAVPVVPD